MMIVLYSKILNWEIRRLIRWVLEELNYTKARPNTPNGNII